MNVILLIFAIFILIALIFFWKEFLKLKKSYTSFCVNSIDNDIEQREEISAFGKAYSSKISALETQMNVLDNKMNQLKAKVETEAKTEKRMENYLNG